ncbi:helicase C-terminal domain-containing protein [Collimonas humicola]|uniref:helicase C-terminal domain-containing protein n=1 Tax=Collimonas humicola TaxID=2825886 RepID=UPI001B8CB51C|nr:helicase-related protein [Collimonas humicola]
MEFLGSAQTDESRYHAAERFVEWLKKRVLIEARGDDETSSPVDPTGRYWLGRLGPKDFVTRPDSRGDRLEPCAIGLRLRPATDGPWIFMVAVRFCLWRRRRSTDESGLRWAYDKTPFIEVKVPVNIEERAGDQIFGASAFNDALSVLSVDELSADIRVRVTGRTVSSRAIEVTFVNTSSSEAADLADGRFFEASLSITGLNCVPFDLESLPDSFRFNRKVPAYGLNCGVEVDGDVFRTNDGPRATKYRPSFWAVADEKPDVSFKGLAHDPCASAANLVQIFETWSSEVWSPETLEQRANNGIWSAGMREEASTARTDFQDELRRIRRGAEILATDANVRMAFQLMNRSMAISAQGRYSEWRPFQFAFLLANLECLVDRESESDIVDIVWFATGGGKTETYLGLILTAAFLDRMRGKISGVTAWSRFPLRMLSLQQTQRFANALAAAELIRREANIGGDEFSLGFLVGGTSTPNRIKKESDKANEDVDKIEERTNPFKLLDRCPFCRGHDVSTSFDRVLWRLNHLCSNGGCPSDGKPLPIYVIDDEIWRLLPTVVIGTLDKAANISRQTGMRGLFGSPKGKCTKPGHGYTYAIRSGFPNGCLVPDCRGGAAGPLPMANELYPATFRLQDELHLLRDSLGAIDAHYECSMDGIEEAIAGSKPKILASSATLTGYKKQVDVLYKRKARVFPQLPPVDGQGFWATDSVHMMRCYLSLAPRRLTVEFVVDKLIVTLQKTIRSLHSAPEEICSELNIDLSYAPFLVNLYGTNVVYGNTLQDIDAVVRSSETQYAELDPPPNIATLTGRTDFEEVRQTLNRLESPEPEFENRLHLIAASSMMSHGVDIDRLNVMIMLAFPLGVAEFIQATARVGRRWPALVLVIPKMTRERDASVYRAFPEFVTHGDRFVEPIPITRKSRRVLERTISGLELARITMIHEPSSSTSITTIKSLNAFVSANPNILADDEQAIAKDLGLTDEDEFMRKQLTQWFKDFSRNLREPPSDSKFLSDLCPTGSAMISLRDVEEQVPIKGDSTR